MVFGHWFPQFQYLVSAKIIYFGASPVLTLHPLSLSVSLFFSLQAWELNDISCSHSSFSSSSSSSSSVSSFSYPGSCSLYVTDTDDNSLESSDTIQLSVEERAGKQRVTSAAAPPSDCHSQNHQDRSVCLSSHSLTLTTCPCLPPPPPPPSFSPPPLLYSSSSSPPLDPTPSRPRFLFFPNHWR